MAGLAIGIGLLSSSPIRADEDAPVVPHDKFALRNGLTVLLHEDHSVPRVHVTLRYRVGSAYEEPGRTGFAHLFEHLMFEGSKNVPEGKFDEWLEAAGGENNAWTSEDNTTYYEEGPSNALELMLFLESDRMGHFVDGLVDSLVDGQRDVVKNERRQSYENQPYGRADLALPALLYPKGHPYSWPVIGSMEDLTAARIDDVRRFFTRFYAPENAILVIAGDFDPAVARPLVESWFSDVPPRGGRPAPPPAPITLRHETRAVFTEDVALPQLRVVWPTTHLYGPDDAALDVVAALLGQGGSARLNKALVRDRHLATSVAVAHGSHERAGDLEVTVMGAQDAHLPDVLRVVDDEIARLSREGPRPEELARIVAQLETAQADTLDHLGSKAAALSQYAMYVGNGDWFRQDLARYRAVDARAVQDVVKRYLGRGRVVLSTVGRDRLRDAVLSPVLPSMGGVQ